MGVGVIRWLVIPLSHVWENNRGVLSTHGVIVRSSRGFHRGVDTPHMDFQKRGCI
jgi:hypothetical protein